MRLLMLGLSSPVEPTRPGRYSSSKAMYSSRPFRSTWAATASPGPSRLSTSRRESTPQRSGRGAPRRVGDHNFELFGQPDVSRPEPQERIDPELLPDFFDKPGVIGEGLLRANNLVGAQVS